MWIICEQRVIHFSVVLCCRWVYVLRPLARVGCQSPRTKRLSAKRGQCSFAWQPLTRGWWSNGTRYTDVRLLRKHRSLLLTVRRCLQLPWSLASKEARRFRPTIRRVRMIRGSRRTRDVDNSSTGFTRNPAFQSRFVWLLSFTGSNRDRLCNRTRWSATSGSFLFRCIYNSDVRVHLSRLDSIGSIRSGRADAHYSYLCVHHTLM